MYDVTGSYEPGFNLAGAMISLSGLMLFVVPYMDTKPYLEVMQAEAAAKARTIQKQVSDLQSDAACTDTVTTVIAMPMTDD